MKNTSDRIKEAMEIRGIKQSEIVEKTGISKGALSSYISGKYIPKQTNTYKIAKVLDVDISWLMGSDVPMNTDNSDASSSYKVASLINRLRKDEEALELLKLYYENLNSENKKRILDLARALGGC